MTKKHIIHFFEQKKICQYFTFVSFQEMATRQNGETSGFPAIVELNVGGVFYSTSLNTLTSEPNSKIGQLFGGTDDHPVLKDSKVSNILVK